MPHTLEDRRVVVIGGTAGMGLATAEAAAAAGAQVIVASRTQARVGDAVARIGERASGALLDISDNSAVAAFFDGIDPLDHVVVSANAASSVLGVVKPLAEMEPAAAESFLATKFWGPFYVGKHAPKKLNVGGSIVFFSGAAARRSLKTGRQVLCTRHQTQAGTGQNGQPARQGELGPGGLRGPRTGRRGGDLGDRLELFAG